MNEEERIKKFDEEQLELLLNNLQDIDKFTGFKDGAFKYELGKYQANLLVNCINKYKEVINKAIKYIEENKQHEYRNGNSNEYYLELNEKEMTELLDILKEVEHDGQ